MIGCMASMPIRHPSQEQGPNYTQRVGHLKDSALRDTLTLQLGQAAAYPSPSAICAGTRQRSLG